MKKLQILAMFLIFISLFALFAGASVEEINWGSQSITLGSKYATISAVSGPITEVQHSFENVGYVYLNATCQAPAASFNTTMQKKGFLGIWTNKMTVNCYRFNYSIEWGAGGAYGQGTYRFLLEPVNNFVPNASGIGGTYYTINIQNFGSRSDP